MTLKQAPQSTIQVINGAGSSLSDGAFVSATFDASTNKPPSGKLVFRGTCNDTALTLGVNVYLLELDSGGTLYPEDVVTDWAPYYVGNLPLKDGISGEQVSVLSKVSLPQDGKGKIFLEADTDGTAISSGYDLDLVPSSVEDGTVS